MHLLTLMKQILRDMWSRKWRSALALFGIAWGTLTVILLLALGNGFHQASEQNIMKFAEGTFFVMPGKTGKSFQGFPKGRSIKVKANTIFQLKEQIPNIQEISPLLVNKTSVGTADKQSQREVFGASYNIKTLQKIDLLDKSRFFTPVDTLKENHVAVLGYKLKTRVFGNKPAVGKNISINNIPFLIVGVIQNPKKHQFSWYDRGIIIPHTTYIRLFGDQDIPFFIVSPNPNVDADQIERTIKHYFAKKYHFDPKDKEALRIQNLTRFFQFFKWFFIGIQIFLGICGTLTLAVGGLGVANIMYLIVNERTKEIGLRMAVGATDTHILVQIILESLIIISIGGLIGFLFAYLTTFIMQFIDLPTWLGKPTISYTVVFVSISVLIMLGLLAGYFPARRAAKMDPVEALGC